MGGPQEGRKSGAMRDEVMGRVWRPVEEVREEAGHR